MFTLRTDTRYPNQTEEFLQHPVEIVYDKLLNHDINILKNKTAEAALTFLFERDAKIIKRIEKNKFSVDKMLYFFTLLQQVSVSPCITQISPTFSQNPRIGLAIYYRRNV